MKGTTPLFLYAREFLICEIEVKFRCKKYYQCYHQLIKADSGQDVSIQSQVPIGQVPIGDIKNVKETDYIYMSSKPTNIHIFFSEPNLKVYMKDLTVYTKFCKNDNVIPLWELNSRGATQKL